MKSSTEVIIEQLRSEYPGELAVRPGCKRRIFSPAFKQRVISEAEVLSVPASAIAIGLGISIPVVSKWKRQLGRGRTSKGKKSSGAMFRKIEVEVEPEYERTQTPYLEGKSGVRALGLSMSQMAELLRCL